MAGHGSEKSLLDFCWNVFVCVFVCVCAFTYLLQHDTITGVKREHILEHYEWGVLHKAGAVSLTVNPFSAFISLFYMFLTAKDCQCHAIEITDIYLQVINILLNHGMANIDGLLPMSGIPQCFFYFSTRLNSEFPNILCI